MGERMGGVVVFCEATTISLNLQYTGDWHCDFKSFVECFHGNSRYLTNYTLGHENNPNHSWRPINYQVYSGNNQSDYDSVCVVSYVPNSPEFIRQYAELLNK